MLLADLAVQDLRQHLLKEDGVALLKSDPQTPSLPTSTYIYNIYKPYTSLRPFFGYF